MESKTRLTFLLLVGAQALHSVEEYALRLYEVFAPARFISESIGGLIGADLATGFAIVNAALVAFGAWCYAARVRPDHPSARAWMWPWVFIELANGIVHPAIALGQGAYFPGAATAPLLFGIAAYLAHQLAGTRAARAHPERPAS